MNSTTLQLTPTILTHLSALELSDLASTTKAVNHAHTPTTSGVYFDNNIHQPPVSWTELDSEHLAFPVLGRLATLNLLRCTNHTPSEHRLSHLNNQPPLSQPSRFRQGTYFYLSVKIPRVDSQGQTACTQKRFAQHYVCALTHYINHHGLYIRDGQRHERIKLPTETRSSEYEHPSQCLPSLCYC